MLEISLYGQRKEAGYRKIPDVIAPGRPQGTGRNEYEHFIRITMALYKSSAWKDLSNVAVRLYVNDKKLLVLLREKIISLCLTAMRLEIRPDYIEHQLAHAVRDPNGRAHNRTAHLPERHKMMQTWADYVYGVRNGKVITGKFGKST